MIVNKYPFSRIRPLPYIGKGLLLMMLYINLGISFSGCCFGPKLFEQLVIIAGKLKVLT